jgi:hypothetical protein
VLVTGQVDDAGDFPSGAEPAWPPDVLVDAELGHTGEPVGQVETFDGDDADRVPDGVPVDAEPARERADRRVIIGERVDRPADRPRGERRLRCRQRMLAPTDQHLPVTPTARHGPSRRADRATRPERHTTGSRRRRRRSRQ